MLALAAIALSCVLGGVALRLVGARRQRPFADACLGLAAGAPMTDVHAQFSRVGERSSGHASHGSDPRPQAYAFFRRSGWARWQQCTVEVEPATQRVTATRYEAGSDFTSCADRHVYPRRFWLCAIADAVAP